MKKIISVCLCAVLIFCAFCACSGEAETDVNDNKQEKLSIVTTIFPIYDWIMEILGDKAEEADVKMLIDTGVDLHSFQPSPSDIMAVSECDVFVFVGGESDNWIGDILNSAENKDMISINLMETLGSKAKTEEIKEGMEEEDGEEDGEIEYDEHIWLSLENAKELVSQIAEKICLADEENRDAYIKNANAYINKLDALDDRYESEIEKAKNDTVVFADRFPFRYLVDDYDLNYYAAFVGCSAESEASFKTVSFLAEKLNEKSLKYVMTLEGTDHRIAEAVIANTNRDDIEILSVDSLQSVTGTDVENGAKYLDIMEKNLDVFLKALGSEA